MNTGLKFNEVGTTLDAQRKPILGTSPYFSQRVAKWFRPWQPGDFAVPVYTIAGAYLRDTTVQTDTAYKNMVFPDSLTFTLDPGSAGVYQCNNPAFFALDGRGFDSDDPGGQNPAHKFGFAMEMHWEFTYQKGLTYNFSGDDDMWVFVNNSRVIDLGGIHGPASASVNLDNLAGMTVGQKYNLDVFSVERKAVGSDILVTTNIFSPSIPMTFMLAMAPGADTAIAGGFVAYRAMVLDDTAGIRHEFDSLISWTLAPAGTTSTLTGTTGSVDTFFARQAYTFYVIGASFTEDSVASPRTLWAFDTVYVKPEPSDLARFSATKVLDRTKPVCEYYNLRGQKLRTFGNSRVDGIVFERVIENGGVVSVKRKFLGADSKVRNPD